MYITAAHINYSLAFNILGQIYYNKIDQVLETRTKKVCIIVKKTTRYDNNLNNLYFLLLWILLMAHIKLFSQQPSNKKQALYSLIYRFAVQYILNKISLKCWDCFIRIKRASLFFMKIACEKQKVLISKIYRKADAKAIRKYNILSNSAGIGSSSRVCR